MKHIKLEHNFNLEILDAHAALSDANSGAGKGDECWRNLWREPMRTNHLKQIEQLKNTLNKCTQVIVLGIGGSATGTRALCEALLESEQQLHIVDNIDPHTVNQTINKAKAYDETLSHTVVIVISKSGNTTETVALCMSFYRAMPSATYVAITGNDGTLHEYAIKKNWATLPIPQGVGGRFSALSHVGLFPLALFDIDIARLLQGAADMDDACKEEQDNPALTLAIGLTNAMKDGRKTHIMMSYANNLFPLAQWYVQLIAESLGKINSKGERVGPTPIAAVGSTDQHSMLQLWREGPEDKVIGFLAIDEGPDIQLSENVLSEDFNWLSNQSMRRLLDTELQATITSLKEANQLTWLLKLPKCDCYSIGQFIALWQITIAIAGRILCVNAYDQPGVELSKKLTRQHFQK